MGAAYDSGERHPAPRCLPGTRSTILEKIETWAEAGSEGKSILWLHGPAGAGKSAIAQTVAETCAKRKELAASFFFARTVASRNSLKHLFPTIAVQIALSAPETRQRLDSILRNDPWIAERASGSVDLVVLLFQDSSTPAPSSRFLVVIDGLDECQRHNDQRHILAEVARLVNTHHLPLRFLIVSRPEAHICEAFEEPDLANIAVTLSLYGARDDVSKYLRTEFSRISDAKRYKDVLEFVPRPWPSEDIIDRLVDKSGGYFIYASTVIKFIDEENLSPAERLDQILNGSNSAISPSDPGPFSELDKLYLQILLSCPSSKIPILKLILGYAELSDAYLTVAELEALFGLPRGQVKLLLRGLRSLVSFTEWYGGSVTVRLDHASFGDFLHDKERSGVYYVDVQEWVYTAFCRAFSFGCRLLGFSVDADVELASRHPIEGLSVKLSMMVGRTDISTSRL